MPPPGYEPFLKTILDDPAADAPRLVYADWLEEQGDVRAEFIRLQVERSHLPENDRRIESYTDRETALLNAHRDEWESELPVWARAGCDFVRGFVEHVHIWKRWEAVYGPLLAAAAPVIKLTLHEVAGAIGDFAAGPWLRHLSELEFVDSNMGPDELKDLCDSETAFVGLRSLQFMDMHLMDTGGFLLSRCPRLSRLQQLELIRCKIEERGVVELAETRHLPALTWLNLSDNRIGEQADRMAVFLVTSPLMRQLKRLYLNDNELTSEIARALAESEPARNLTHIELSGNHIGDRGARLIMEAFPNLQRLNLAGNILSISVMLDLKEKYGDRVHLGRPGE
jgi:uncharacterized protein (TIGR02996 family)